MEGREIGMLEYAKLQLGCLIATVTYMHACEKLQAVTYGMSCYQCP